MLDRTCHSDLSQEQRKKQIRSSPSPFGIIPDSVVLLYRLVGSEFEKLIELHMELHYTCRSLEVLWVSDKLLANYDEIFGSNPLEELEEYKLIRRRILFPKNNGIVGIPYR